jgi:hypothetical protein
LAQPASNHLLSDYYDEHQLAEELDHDVRTLRGWRRYGKGPPFTRIGRRAFYRKSAVVEWLLAREREVAA